MRNDRFTAVTIERLDDAILGYGKSFFVNANGANAGATAGYGTSWEAPFSTIDAAYNQCTAGNGDIIWVAAEHTESISTDGGLAADIADVSIIGLGEGDNRALITIDTLAAAAVIISGAGNVVKNLRFSIGIDAATDPIQISGAGSKLVDCEIIEAASCEAIDLVSITGSRCVVDNLVIEGRNTGDGDAHCALHLDGCDQVTIRNVTARGGDWEEGVLKNEGDECLDLVVEDCYFTTEATENILFAFDTNATGMISKFRGRLSGAGAATEIENAFTLGKVNLGEDVGVALADGGIMTMLTGGGAAPVTVVSGGGGAAPTATQHFYVSADGASTNSGESWAAALDTIKNALAKCTDGEANVIHVDARYTENIENATDLAVNKIDVSIIGEGSGDNRPTLTLTTAVTANIPISGAGVTLDNFIITCSGTFDITAGLTVGAAGVTIRNCEWRGVDADTDFSSCILTTNAAERLRVLDCTFRVSDTLPTHGINVVGAIDGLVVRGCHFYGTFSTGCIDFTTAPCTNALIEDCTFHNKSAAVTKDVVDTVTGSTFIVRNCWDNIAGYEIAGSGDRDVAYSGGGPIILQKVDGSPFVAEAVNLFLFEGTISIDRIDGHITTAIQSQGTTVQLHAKASQAAAAVALDAGALDINGFAVNSNIHWNKDASDSLIGTTDVSVYEGTATAVQHPFTAHGLAITSAITVTMGATSTGQITWTLAYTPLSPGAYAKPA